MFVITASKRILNTLTIIIIVVKMIVNMIFVDYVLFRKAMFSQRSFMYVLISADSSGFQPILNAAGNVLHTYLVAEENVCLEQQRKLDPDGYKDTIAADR